MGILSANSTLDISDIASNGMVILNPTAGDNSTATLNRLNAGSTRIKALQPAGYVTVNQANQLKFGNANLDVNADGFLAICVRIPPDDLTSGYYQLLQSTQTYGASLPKLAITVRSNNFTVGTESRLPVIDCQAADLTSTVKNVLANAGWTDTGSFDQIMTPFGNPTPAKNSAPASWVWVIMARAGVTPPADTGVVTMGSTTTWISANKMNVGYAFADEDFGEVSSGSLNIRNSGLTLSSSGATNGLNTYTGLDFIIGGNSASTANKPFDVSTIIKCSVCPDIKQMIGLLRGLSFADVGITATAQDKIINLDSLTAAGADITVQSGTPVFSPNATDGPMRFVDVGTLTTALAKTIASGKVTL